MKIVIIDYGAGNVKSIEFALNRLGYDAELSHNADTILRADKVIFPGVGAANAAMEMLKLSNLDTLIPKLTQPVLGICLGMQLMCEYTEEGNTTGLGIFEVSVRRFSDTVKVPQMGWNTVKHLKSELFKHIDEDTYMYSVHSYYADSCKQAIATTYYNHDYASALHYKNFYGVQFHPEKSGSAGAQLLKNFLEL